MTEPKTHPHRFRKIVLCGILTGVLFVVVCPAIEITRGEYRIGQAYNATLELAALLSSDLSISREEADPWGEPYRVIQLPEGPVVVSTGPNQNSPLSGFDDDDIHSGMSVSPMETIVVTKQRWLVFALSLPVLWFVGSIVYLVVGLSKASNRGHGLVR